MARHKDTIAALATPAGTAALAIIRISGPDTNRLARGLFGPPPPPRAAAHRDYVDLGGSFVDDVVATRFEGPNSYTGEDTLEISCHGSPFIAAKILADLLARGCRPAGPGEFTQRAFLNGRMDLSQAEAVMEVISARSDRALSAAQQVLRGALGRHLATLVDGIVEVLSSVEAYIDFPDEDLPAGGPRKDGCASQRDTQGRGPASRHRAHGLPPARGDRDGDPRRAQRREKLAPQQDGGDRPGHRQPEPGTTRDFIEERLNVGPHGLRLIDTAGLNPAATGTERLGIEKTLERAAGGDLFILVLDATRPTPPSPTKYSAVSHHSNTVVVLNKSDLLGAKGLSAAAPPSGFSAATVSALTGAGLDSLLAQLARLAEGLQTTVGEERIAINVRHAHYLSEARACLGAALAKIESGPPNSWRATSGAPWVPWGDLRQGGQRAHARSIVRVLLHREVTGSNRIGGGFCRLTMPLCLQLIVYQ
jgi:tRNA modification GTPase